MKMILMLVAALICLAGCASNNEGGNGAKHTSPTAALIRGELTTEQYLEAIKKANEEDRKNDQFEANKEPTRAYNTKTGRFEYVPEGTIQKWNDETQRWEFTPID